MVQNVPAEAIKTGKQTVRASDVKSQGPRSAWKWILAESWAFFGHGMAGVQLGRGTPEDPILFVYLKIKQTKKLLSAERNKKPLWGSVKLLLHNPKNLSLNPRTPAKSQVSVVTAFVPGTC